MLLAALITVLAYCPCNAKKKEFTDEGARSGIVEKFFDKAYIPAMTGTNRIFPAFCIIACVTWGIFATTLAFQLTPPLEQEKWFSDSHMFTGLLEDNSNLFLGGVDDQYVKMNFVYGVTGIDRDKNPSGKKFNKYIPSDNRGTVIFDSAFDITNYDTQQDILTACTTIQDWVCNAKACSGGAAYRISKRRTEKTCSRPFCLRCRCDVAAANFALGFL